VTQRNVDARTLKGMLQRGERIAVVDVRKREEYAQGSIPGSVNFDAYDALKAGDGRAMEGLELLEGARVVTFCNRGHSGAVPQSSCGNGVTKRSPWKPGRGSKACPCVARVGPYRSTG
jgi:rhodanese-related sulfurtransferase